MDNDRSNRNDYGSRDSSNWNDDWRNRSSDDNRNYGSRENFGGDYSRESSRRDHGGSGNFYGSNRDDYGNRGGSSFNNDRGYNAGQSGGGYDEWSRRGTRSFADRGYGSEGSQNYGNFDRDYGSRDYNRDRSFGGQSRSGGWSSGRPYGGGERGAAEGGRGFWDKATDEVSSWFGDRDAERRRDMDQHRGRGPKGYARSDERIKDDVSDRLTDDGWLDATEIEVAVSNREVTLSGTVSDRNAKRRAEDIAEGVSGVTHVQNNIRVKARDATSTDVDVDRTGATAGIAKTGAGGMR